MDKYLITPSGRRNLQEENLEEASKLGMPSPPQQNLVLTQVLKSMYKFQDTLDKLERDFVRLEDYDIEAKNHSKLLKTCKEFSKELEKTKTELRKR